MFAAQKYNMAKNTCVFLSPKLVKYVSEKHNSNLLVIFKCTYFMFLKYI